MARVWLSKVRDLPNDSAAKTVVVALAVCLAGSLLVTTAAVLLQPLQQANQERERQKHIIQMVESLRSTLDAAGETGELDLEARVVDLATGDYAISIDPETYDQRAAASDPAQSIEIPPHRDIAGINRRARAATVHLALQDGEVRLVVLPVHGKGFASTLYGYLGLTGDTQSVVGLVFYEHNETPALGALIDSPKWRGQWPGKKVWGPLGDPALEVVMTGVDPTSLEAQHQVDGLTGATWTSRGVSNLLRFWLGEDGFGPYLRKLRREGDER